MTSNSEHAEMLALLKHARLNNCLGQAYLLAGDDGDFLKQFVKEWMKIAACSNPLPDGGCCNHCDICIAIDNETYGECFSVAPLSKSRIITIDAMRQFDHMLGLAARKDHLKIGVIYDAECMGEEAQNSFLKTLEEPPANTLLLLMTSNPRKLLPTIRSRCQVVSLLQNRKSYEGPLSSGLFDVLSTLHRGAGIGVAMKGMRQITSILGKLATDAEQIVLDNWDANWETVEDGDAQLKKQLADLKQKKIDTEYCRLRELYLDAIQAWFMQKYLISTGVKRDCLPHPEFFRYYSDSESINLLDAEENCVWCNDMLQCLQANVNEHIALQTFLLQVCQ